MDTDDDDVEYEEIEEEVEVEEEEEVEEEVDEEEVEQKEEEVEEEEEILDEDPSGSPISLDRKDVSRGRESKGHAEHLKSDYFDPVDGNTGESKFSTASEANDKPLDGVEDPKYPKLGQHLAASESLESADHKKHSVAVVGRGALNKDYAKYDSNASLDCEIMTVETTKPLLVSRNVVAAATSAEERFIEKAHGVVDVDTENKEVEQSREDVCEGQRSSTLPQVRPRSLSSDIELNDINKRPAVLCNFFAKGWCIKGNSCKFLHVKDHLNITSQKSEGDEAMLKERSELQAHIGLRDGSERLQPARFHKAAISSVSLERSPSQEVGESQSRHQFNESREFLSCQREDFSHGISPDPPQLQNYKDSGSISSVRDFGRENLKLNSSVDSSINRKHCFPDTYSSLSSSPWTRAPFSFTSLDKDPLFASGSTSLIRSSSPFSGSDSKNHSLLKIFADPLPVAGRKISSDDWEPSVPFRPSFSITKSLLSSLTLYDPIRDSIEQPNLGDGFSKFSSRPETSITNTHLSIEKEPALSRTIYPEYGSDLHSISGHHELHDKSDKNFQSRNSFSTEEPVGVYNAEQKLETNLRKEEKLSRHVLVKDNAEAKKGIHDSYPRLRKDGIKQKKELDLDKDRQKNEWNLDLRRDGEQRESKAMKHFRVALIDFVKELVKPTWLEGHLSKDAYKMIVKKAVEKVLGTVQPHQIPSTEETVKLYLSTSQPKISKLVGGYVIKYGKS